VENKPFYRHIKREWPQGYDWEADESFNDIIQGIDIDDEENSQLQHDEGLIPSTNPGICN